MDWSLIDLNNYEGKVLEALISLGESTINEVSKESGVPRNKVYEVLESLMNKGLVNKTNIKPLRYSPVGTKEAVKQLLTQRQGRVKNFLKGLDSLEKKPKRTIDVKVYEGRQNWHRALKFLQKNIIEPQNLFNYSIRHSFKHRHQYVRESLKAKKEGVKIKSLGPVNKRTIKNVDKFRKLGDKIKNFPNEKTSVRITNKGVVIGLINSETTMVITDPYFIRMMKKLHEAAWKGAQ